MDRVLLLSILDTVHDFYKERGTQADDEEDVDTGKMEFIRGFIDTLIKTLYPQVADASDINSILSGLTGGNIKSPYSNFEPNVVKMYESAYPFDLYSKTKREDTYDVIVENVEAMKGIYDGLRGVSNVLTLTPADGSSFGNLDASQKNRLANFILHYFFGPAPANPRFSFDGKSGIIAKIFKDIEQSRNLIFPQTIADSAPTSFNSFSGRNEFIFPGDGQRIDAVSNIYTLGEYIISFINKGYHSKNPFGFVLRIARGVSAADIPFSAKQTEGPSVNYLISLLQHATGDHDLTKATATKETTLKIGPYLQAVPDVSSPIVSSDALTIKQKALLLDIKRTGDHEQVRAALSIHPTYPFTIFCTIDHLCALYARLNKQNCIFHVGEKLVLFRFETGPVDPAKQATIEAYWKAKQSQDIIQKLRKLTEEDLPNKLVEQAKRFNAALNKGVAPKCVAVKPECKLTTILFRIKIYDILKKLLDTGIITYNSGTGEYIPSVIFGSFPDVEGVLQGYIRKYESNQVLSGEDIASVNAAVEATITNYEPFLNKIREFNINLVEGRPIDVVKDIITADNSFAAKRFHELFNYSSEPFINLQRNITEITGTIQRWVSGRYRGEFDIISILTRIGYFDNIEKITAQFFDVDTGNDIRSILDVNARLPDGVDKNTTAAGWLTTGSDNIFQQIQASYSRISELPVMAGGRLRITQKKNRRHKKQRGGAGYPGQYMDLSDLLRNICAMASTYVESVYCEVSPNESIKLLWNMIKTTPESQTHANYISLVESIRTLQGKAVSSGNEFIKSFPVDSVIPAIQGGDAASVAASIETLISESDTIFKKYSPYEFLDILSNPEWVSFTTKAINDIVFEWELGLQTIRTTDGYELRPTNMEDILMYFLGFITTTAGIDHRLYFEDDSIYRRATDWYSRVYHKIALLPPTYIAAFQLLILHFLHFRFRDSPAIIFRPPRLSVNNYDDIRSWDESLYTDLMNCINAIKGPGQPMVGGRRHTRRKHRKLSRKHRR